jgi:hypothetical protein
MAPAPVIPAPAPGGEGARQARDEGETAPPTMPKSSSQQKPSQAVAADFTNEQQRAPRASRGPRLGVVPLLILVTALMAGAGWSSPPELAGRGNVRVVPVPWAHVGLGPATRRQRPQFRPLCDDSGRRDGEKTRRGGLGRVGLAQASSNESSAACSSS